jgi:ABC-type nitrate/sulfonate/bicarbonate transport system substrate-binding protein
VHNAAKLDMSISQLAVIYGHLEGTNFARDPSGYLSIEAGIYLKNGLSVSWRHVQGTEERYRLLESGEAQISFVVGRASLQHFLANRSTRILGCAMNSCAYYLVTDSSIGEIGDLKGRTVACREGPARGVPFAQLFRERAGLELGKHLTLRLSGSDQEAFNLLLNKQLHGAFLPRPYGFLAEEQGFKRIVNWPDVVDDPLPITIETTAQLWRERGKELSAFVEAHCEGIRYLKTHRAETIRMLQNQFGHSPSLAAKTYEEYLLCMDEGLRADFVQVERLLAQVAPDRLVGARGIASEWIVSGALRG